MAIFNAGEYVGGLTGDLTADEQNQAMANVGSDYRVPTPQGQPPPAQQGSQDGWQQAQKYVGATQGLTAQEGESNGLQRALGIVGKIYSFGG